VLDFQVHDGVFDHGARAEVAGVDDVGDVAVHEDVARLQAHDGCFRDARVGASDPEDFGTLACGEAREELRVGGGGFFGPFFVLPDGELDFVWLGEGVVSFFG